jgi:hypothetical protein
VRDNGLGNESQWGHQTVLGQHPDRDVLGLVEVQRVAWIAQQYGDNAVAAGYLAHVAGLAVDQHVDASFVYSTFPIGG